MAHTDLRGARMRGCHALMPVAAGGFVSNQYNGAGFTTQAAANLRCDYAPFVPARRLRLDRGLLYVTTGVAAAKARLAIYDDTGAMYPGDLLGETGEFDCSTTNTNPSSDFAAPVDLSPDTLYWLALLFNSTQTLRVLSATGSMALGASDGSTGSANTILRITNHAYGAFPAQAPNGAFATTATPGLIRFRVA